MGNHLAIHNPITFLLGMVSLLHKTGANQVIYFFSQIFYSTTSRNYIQNEVLYFSWVNLLEHVVHRTGLHKSGYVAERTALISAYPHEIQHRMVDFGIVNRNFYLI